MTSIDRSHLESMAEGPLLHDEGRAGNLTGFSLIFLLTFVLVGYDGHSHVHHRVEDHNKSIRKPRFAIHALCHEEDLKSWLLNINFKKEDLHGLSIGAHSRYLLSDNLQ